MGYSRFNTASHDIHQLTCGGGDFGDGYSKMTFMYDEYNDGQLAVTPYSYSDRGGRTWAPDYTLHRRLDGSTLLTFPRFQSSVKLTVGKPKNGFFSKIALKNTNV